MANRNQSSGDLRLPRTHDLSRVIDFTCLYTHRCPCPIRRNPPDYSDKGTCSSCSRCVSFTFILKFCISFCFTLFPFFIYCEPWGKDADLVNCQKSPTCETPRSSLITQWGIKAIRFHQEVISPADGPRSHFIPSSSQYTLNAMSKYGFLTGFVLGCDRLMRENNDEWVYRKTVNSAGKMMKYDPVPPCLYETRK